MFQKLNLLKFHCEELCIETHLKLPRELAERIVASSHGHKKHNVPDYAVYGCIYTIDQIPYTVRAHIRRLKQEAYHMEFLYLSEKWPRPPKDFNSPQILANLLSEEPWTVTFECNAHFTYDKKDGWASRIDIPMLLDKQVRDTGLFTHIEAIKFSKQEQGQIDYSIQISRTSQGDIHHCVYITELWRGILSGEIPKHLLERSAELSRTFVTKKRKG